MQPATTSAPRQANDDVPSDVLFQLLTVTPVTTLADLGVFELRFGDGESQCNQHNATLLVAANTVVQCLEGPSQTVSTPSTWFSTKLSVVDNTTGLIGTVCGDGWSDDNATAACKTLSAVPRDVYARGYVVRHFDDSRQNQWPILAAYSQGQSVAVLSGCLSKRNNCTHSGDVGVVCSQSQYSNHLETLRFFIAMEIGVPSLRDSLPLLVPSSKSRMNITTIPIGDEHTPFGSRFVNASNVTLFVMEFTAMCGDVQPARSELEQMFLLINSVGLDILGIVDVNVTEHSLAMPDCPISYSATTSASHTVTTIVVYLRVMDAMNITNVTGTLQRLLGIANELSFVVVSPQVCAVYFPSAALALSAVELVSSGLIPGVLAASFLQADAEVNSDNGPSSGSSSTTTIAVVVAVVLVIALVAVIVAVLKKRMSSASGSGASKGSLTVLDGEMNTLFLPINLDDLEEWQPPAGQTVA
jgi:hypothetical protein